MHTHSFTTYIGPPGPVQTASPSGVAGYLLLAISFWMVAGLPHRFPFCLFSKRQPQVFTKNFIFDTTTT